MTIRRPVVAFVAAALLYAVLALPDRPAATPGPFPLELPVLLLALVALPARSSSTMPFRIVAVAWLGITAVLKAADFGMFTAFNRPFNPILDLPLVKAGFGLMLGAIGPWLTVAALAGSLLATMALVAALWWATGVWASPRPTRPLRLAAAAALVVAIAAVAVDLLASGAGHARWPDPPGAAAALRQSIDRIEAADSGLTDLRLFESEAARDPFPSGKHWLDRLAGHDVLVVFVESYGRTSFENPLYRPTHVSTLKAAETRLAERGLAMRSGWLSSPVTGGQSWLAHGTLASGLRIDNQNRYGAMLASARRTLFHIAEAAGFRTAAVVPAITLAWPEGRQLGFEDIRAAADLGYRGKPFNWITMPDQFTLSAADRLVRNGNDARPLFGEIVLISSHAPWVPIPERVAWDDVGDGRIFDKSAVSGDPPEIVWRDPDRVRDQYRLAIDYSLSTVMDYVARQARPPLMVVLGDHQPAPFVAGNDSRDVPIHIIGPPDLLAMIDGWGWSEGLVPAASVPAWPMEAFRDRFIRAYSSEPSIDD